MCSINHELKAIYIHLPKCGGTFINSALQKYYNFTSIQLPHENHEQFIPFHNDEFVKDTLPKSDSEFGLGFPWAITEGGILQYTSSSEIFNYTMEMTQDKWKNYKKFTIVRNPYDKFISAWNFINKCLKHKRNQVPPLSLHEYINKSKEELYKFDQVAYSHSHITQYQHLLDTNNEFHIDYIGNFENLNEDFCDILLKIGVDKIKHEKYIKENTKLNSTEHSFYIDYYDDNILKKINEIVQKDFEVFKQYKIVNSVEEMLEEHKKESLTNSEFKIKNVNLYKRLEKDNLIENVFESKINKNEKLRNTEEYKKQ